MHVSTKAALAEVKEADFFSKLGQPVRAPGIIAVNSWEKAMALCRTREWENLRIEAQNQLTAALHSQCRERFSKTWNKTVDALYRVLVPLLTEKVHSVVGRERLPKKVLRVALRDVCCVCMEAEYSDVIAPGWYTKQLKPWYLKGHLPCGWTGEFLREGKLMVF
jgi:hypothetical protein